MTVKKDKRKGKERKGKERTYPANGGREHADGWVDVLACRRGWL